MSKIKKHLLFFFTVILFIGIFYFLPYELYFNDNISFTLSELNNMCKNNPFLSTKVVSADDNGDPNEVLINFKPFNMFSIHKLRANIIKDNFVLVGGNAVGFSMKGDGVLVVGSNPILTKYGLVDTISNVEIKVGDRIKKLNSIEIKSIEDIESALELYKSDTDMKVGLYRNGNYMEVNIRPALDIYTGKHKLGLWIKDDITGVGTLTYVDDNKYGALGHAVVASETGEKYLVSSGTLYKSDIIGVKKSVRGMAGQLLGSFNRTTDIVGDVVSNLDTGVYGNINENASILSNKKQVQIGGRASAVPGKATILCTLNGNEIAEYDIEIIKTNYQSNRNEKSMVIKITDERLLSKTGGIVQGMSGSPIMQNGRLIGAVTHVFVNDPTKGFGLYIDWMIG